MLAQLTLKGDTKAAVMKVYYLVAQQSAAVHQGGTQKMHTTRRVAFLLRRGFSQACLQAAACPRCGVPGSLCSAVPSNPEQQQSVPSSGPMAFDWFAVEPLLADDAAVHEELQQETATRLRDGEVPDGINLRMVMAADDQATSSTRCVHCDWHWSLLVGVSLEDVAFVADVDCVHGARVS